MKKFFVSTALSTVVVFVACTQPGKNEQPDPDSPIAVKLSSNITPLATRVINDRWEGSDRIGIFMKPAGAPLDMDLAMSPDANIEASLEANNSTLALTNPLTYPTDGSGVDFVAYYPYDADATMSLTIPVPSLADQTFERPQEILYSGSTTNITASEEVVTLPFIYSLAKICLTVTATEESGLTETDFGNMSVWINGMHTEGEFNIANGSFIEQDEPDMITMYKSGSSSTSATFEALVMPNKTEGGVQPESTFVFMVNDRGLQSTVTIGYESGKLYNMPFELDLGSSSNPQCVLLGAQIRSRNPVDCDKVIVSSR